MPWDPHKMIQKQDRSGDGGNVLQAFDVRRDLSLTSTKVGCIWVHSPEYLCKDINFMGISGWCQASKTNLNAILPASRIAETLVIQHFPHIQKGRRPRIEIDVLLWHSNPLLIKCTGYKFWGFKSNDLVLRTPPCFHCGHSIFSSTYPRYTCWVIRLLFELSNAIPYFSCRHHWMYILLPWQGQAKMRTD